MSGEHNSSGRLAPMALAALGVVFGDIGTSPLYAVSACFTGPGIAVTPEHVLGVLSLIFWSLVLVILLKYVSVVLERRQQGRGRRAGSDRAGHQHRAASPRRKVYGMLGILGASLFFADGAITPAISVLSAVEGLHVAAPDAQIPVCRSPWWCWSAVRHSKARHRHRSEKYSVR
jgi:KUP system potassium uptake protein